MVRFAATADTDIGICKSTNQDSILIKHGIAGTAEVLMAVICDGMGGLAKGELASAVVVRAFSEWFDEYLPLELAHVDMNVIAGKWTLMLKDLNLRIAEYGSREGKSLGTTFTGILFIDRQYLIVHVGDTRVYHIDSQMDQLTEDQTFVAREIRRGSMTKQQARTDKRRNLLLQCVGASKTVEPQILIGETKTGVYMLCSDGFRHEITDEEMCRELTPARMINKQAMHNSARNLIELVKSRQERDNISVVIIKVE